MKKNIGPKPNKRNGWKSKKRRRESALERHEKSLGNYESDLQANKKLLKDKAGNTDFIKDCIKAVEKKVDAVKLVITRTRESLGKEAL